MPEKCKNLFIDALTQSCRINYKYTKKEMDYVLDKKELKDFDIGLSVIGKLRPKRMLGGVVLVDTPYIMR